MTSLQTRIQNGEFVNEKTLPDFLVRKTPEGRQLLEQYQQREREIRDEFREACEQETGLDPDHPLANNLWTASWDNGHAYGYQEVWNYYSDYYSLFVKPLKSFKLVKQE